MWAGEIPPLGRWAPSVGMTGKWTSPQPPVIPTEGPPPPVIPTERSEWRNLIDSPAASSFIPPLRLCESPTRADTAVRPYKPL